MYDVYVDQQWHRGEGEAFQKTCPATGEVSWAGHSASAAQVAEAVSSARRAFMSWSQTDLQTRIDILNAYAKAVLARREPIAHSICRDMGKPLWEGLNEADIMAAKVAISIRAQAERAGHTLTEAAFGHIDLNHRPHGVMAVFGPYNFPGHLPNGHMVPALLAGNTCVFKPSELAPSVARWMMEAFAEAGLPGGVVNLVQGGRPTGAALLEGDIDGLLFTGSAQTGIAFHKQFAGRPEVILALEMGGNNPLIVHDSADIEAAADIVFNSAFVTTGQRCSCARRLIIPEGVFGDDLIEALTGRIKTVPIGAWQEEDIFMGPLVSEAAKDQALRFEEKLAHIGARPVCPFESLDREGAFLRPALIDVTDIRAPDEELFGPLLQISRVNSVDAAIDYANATRFGLAAGFIGDDDQVWEKVLKQLKAGIITRNRPTAGAPSSMPFGGPGLSGNHRPGAYYAADYCAWPQATQIAHKALRQSVAGYNGAWQKS